MDYSGLGDFAARARRGLGRGPVALVLAEDEVELASTLRHHLELGFDHVVLFAGSPIPTPPDLAGQVSRVTADMTVEGAAAAAVNAAIAAAPGRWLFYCFNAEYLFFPFCEDRTVSELLAFTEGERREAMAALVVDLYAADLAAHPDGVACEDAHLDAAGYYALARHGEGGAPLDRQVDVFGGLRWRFEEHVPWARRRIGRTALFRARPGLEIGGDHLLREDELNTVSCPWHHNATAAIASFRAAKALRRNPGSRAAIGSFVWPRSVRFDWHSRQLMELGLMEPGQWF